MALLCLLLLQFLSSGCDALLFHEHFRSRLINVATGDDANTFANRTVNYFVHNITENLDDGVFSQRFWVDLSEYKGKYAMLYISGEGPAKSSPTGFAAEYGHRKNMALFTLEHRYYGESLPRPLTNRSALKSFLSVDSALRDLHDFQRFAEGSILGKPVKWLLVGGSYAGALSVWFRIKYPFAAVASWSSSGVVEAVLDFRDYDNHIRSVLPSECASSIEAAQVAFTRAWDENSVDLKNRFGIPQSFSRPGVDFMLADAVAGPVQYGRKSAMCDMLVPHDIADPLGQFFNMSNTLNGESFTSECGYSTECLNDEKKCSQWGASLPWMYQCCSELAYFQVGFPGSLRLETITLESFVLQCRELFGEDTFPAVSEFNKRFGGLRPLTSNVFATQGSDDPFIEAGIQQSLAANYLASVATCDGCGHCGDLRATLDNSSSYSTVSEQRKEVTAFLDDALTSEVVHKKVLLKGEWESLSPNSSVFLLLQEALEDDFARNYDGGARLKSFDLGGGKKDTITFEVTVFMSKINKLPLLAAEAEMTGNSSLFLPRTIEICRENGIPTNTISVIFPSKSFTRIVVYLSIAVLVVLFRVTVVALCCCGCKEYRRHQNEVYLYERLLNENA